MVLDGEGTFKSAITGIGTPMAICITGGANQFIYSSNSNEAESTENGEIYKVRTTGQVVGRFGSAGKLVKQFGMANSLDCRTGKQPVGGRSSELARAEGHSEVDRTPGLKTRPTCGGSAAGRKDLGRFSADLDLTP